MNKVQLIGRLGRDPEVRSTQGGTKIVNLRLATSERWRDKATGERKERTEWHSVVIFNENVGRIAEQYTRKGSLVYIEGQLQTRKWQDRDGVERYSTEVVLQNFNGSIELLDSRGSGEDDNAHGDRGGRSSGRDSDGRRGGSDRQGTLGGGFGGSAGQSFDDDLDDDVPFARVDGREPGASRRRI